jgi:hypothetical protein
MTERWLKIKEEMMWTNKPEKWDAGGFIKNKTVRIITPEENEVLKRELFLLQNEIEAVVNTYSSVDKDGNQYMTVEDYRMFLKAMHEQKI